MNCKRCQTVLFKGNKTGYCRAHYNSDPVFNRRKSDAVKAAWKRPWGKGRPGPRLPVPADKADDYQLLTSKGYRREAAVEMLTGKS